MSYDLQAIIDQTPGRIELDPADTFICDAPVHILDRTIELTGGATVRRLAPTRRKWAAQIHLRNAAGIVHLNIIGRKKPEQKYVAMVEGHHGYALDGCHDLELRGTVSHVPGDFAYMAALSGGTKKAGTLWAAPCRNITVDLICDDAGRHALAPVGLDGLTIKASSSFTNWRLARIDVEFMGAWHTKRTSIIDEGAFFQKRVKP